NQSGEQEEYEHSLHEPGEQIKTGWRRRVWSVKRASRRAFNGRWRPGLRPFNGFQRRGRLRGWGVGVPIAPHALSYARGKTPGSNTYYWRILLRFAVVERVGGCEFAFSSQLAAALPAEFIRLRGFVAAFFTGLLHGCTSFQ